MEWDDFLHGMADRLDGTLLNDPEYLLARPGYGAPVQVKGDVCVHRLIGPDEQHDGDIVRDHFMPEWRVPIRPSIRTLVADSGPDQTEALLDPIRTGSFLPLNAYSCMTVSPMVMIPPDWVKPDREHQYRIWLVRYVRTT